MNAFVNAFVEYRENTKAEKEPVTMEKIGKAINRMLRDIENLNRLRQEQIEEIESIESKRNIYLKEVIDRKVKEAKDTYVSKIKDFANDLTEACDFIEENYNSVVNNMPFDYSNAEFQATLNLINSAGSNLDFRTQKKIIEQYSHNKTALSLLKSVYQQHGYNTDDFKNMDNSISSQAIENISRRGYQAAYNGEWEKPFLSDIQEIYNFGVKHNCKLEENPLVTELKEYSAKYEGVKSIVNKACEDIALAENESPRLANKVYQAAVADIVSIGTENVSAK